MPLIQVIKFHKKKEEELRQNFRVILGYAASVCTLVIFMIFEEEFLYGIEVNCVHASISLYKVS